VPADGVAVERTPSIDATRDVATVTWRPGEATLLRGGVAAEAALRATGDRAALASAAQLLGLTERMLVLAAEYAKVRVQFAKPIGSFQAVKHHLANAKVRLDFARPATYRAAYAVANDEPGRLVHCAMAKSLASDAADLAGRVALQVHGAIGYTWECDLHLYMKRAWALSAAWGDAPTQRARVLAAALEHPGGRTSW
jgi:alkylation response protein AidB-like acyl-CoA dehydrogenase